MHLIGTWIRTSKNSLFVASYIKQLAQGGFSEAGKGYPFPVGVLQISLKLLDGFASFSTTLNLITISNCSPIFKSLGPLKLFLWSFLCWSFKNFKIRILENLTFFFNISEKTQWILVNSSGIENSGVDDQMLKSWSPSSIPAFFMADFVKWFEITILPYKLGWGPLILPYKKVSVELSLKGRSNE